MCDEQTLKDWENNLKNKPVSRRKFNKITAGAGLAAALPSIASAQPGMTAGMVSVRTPDGIADCYMTHPTDGSHPGVIMWPDILGLRPTFQDMANRIAAQGYAVLVVNPFYRDAESPVVGEGASFADDDVRQTVFALAGTLNAETHITDAIAFVDYMQDHGAVSPNHKMGTTGYCMGGPIVLRTAAARPDQIGAAATFHGGGLATDGADSPHLLIPDMDADFLIAIADNDDVNDPEAKHTLRESFDAESLNAEIEVYEEAQHGWTVPGAAAYHEDQAEHAFERLMVLFDGALNS